jgi:AcrR family transcriptional regulator
MATGERTGQKQRTRHDLLQAASRLMKQGQLPKLPEVAKEAMISRATAYRYFSSDEALIAEAALQVRTPTAAQLFAGDTSLDPEERLLKANTLMHDFAWKNQTQLKFIVARLLDQTTASNGVREMPRQNRRTDFIHTALAPARDRFDAAAYRKLYAAVALVIGTESMLVFHDVLQIEEAEAREVENWAIRVLTQAALLESRTRGGKPLRSISQRDAKKMKAK